MGELQPSVCIQSSGHVEHQKVQTTILLVCERWCSPVWERLVAGLLLLVASGLGYFEVLILDSGRVIDLAIVGGKVLVCHMVEIDCIR